MTILTMNTIIGLQTHSLIPVESESEVGRSTDNQHIFTGIGQSV